MSENLYVIVGPSAVGKNAILDILRKYPYHGRVEELVSATSRPPRCGERDGVDYRFVSRDAFERLRRDGMFAEWVEFEGNLYGTPIDLLSAPSSTDLVKHVAIVDTTGAVVLKDKLGNKATTVFIMPPDEAALEERFRKRSAYDGEDLPQRMARAREDIGMADIFDHVVVNDDLERAAAEVAAIMGLSLKPKEHILDAAIQSPDYLVLYGSQLYGTSTPESDRDERGFVVPPVEYLTGLCKFDQRVEIKPVDRVVWSLAKFVSMLVKGDPQAFEMLFVPDDKILACTDIGYILRDSTDMFACQRFYRRIMGYAESEWRKVRGTQLKPAKRTPTEDSVIEDIRQVFHPDKDGMDEVVRLLFLNHAKEEVSARRKLGAKRKMQVERYGYCTSSASHSIRLLGELSEMLDTGRLTFPRPNAARLLAIKIGEVPYKDVEVEFEDAKSDAYAAAEHTALPGKPDTKGIEKMYHSAIADRLLADVRLKEHISEAP